MTVKISFGNASATRFGEFIKIYNDFAARNIADTYRRTRA